MNNNHPGKAANLVPGQFDDEMMAFQNEQTQLTMVETKELAHLEQVIERGIQTFIEVGTALIEIRDRQLYREGYATFDAYCQQRWGFKRAHAYRLMDAATVVQVVSPMGDIPPPTNERQARPLTQLPTPEAQREAWQEVLDTAPNGTVTAQHVEAVVSRKLTNVTSDQDECRHSPRTSTSFAVTPHTSSASDDWLTPPKMVERVESFLTNFDLDPCASQQAPHHIPAVTVYTSIENGLMRPWIGKVYCNPPYGQTIGQWVQRAIQAYLAGSTEETVLLLPARTDTTWYHRLGDWPCCFVRGRLSFSGHVNAAPFPSAVWYLGPRREAFANAFESLGMVMRRWQPARARD